MKNDSFPVSLRAKRSNPCLPAGPAQGGAGRFLKRLLRFARKDTVMLIMVLFMASFTHADTTLQPIQVEFKETVPEPEENSKQYTVGAQDILSISVLQPEQFQTDVTVSPSGDIDFPYIGNVVVKGRTIWEIGQEIQKRLAEGYFKYPSVVVSLKESHSRKFFVYGQVNHPGPYGLEENTTVLRAISMAEGFSRFGSASRVKILRPKKTTTGYDVIQVNIKAVMDGDSNADVPLRSGDMVVVSEGVF